MEIGWRTEKCPNLILNSYIFEAQKIWPLRAMQMRMAFFLGSHDFQFRTSDVVLGSVVHTYYTYLYIYWIELLHQQEDELYTLVMSSGWAHGPGSGTWALGPKLGTWARPGHLGQDWALRQKLGTWARNDGQKCPETFSFWPATFHKKFLEELVKRLD